MHTLTHAAHTYLSLCLTLIHEGGLSCAFGVAFLAMPTLLLLGALAQVVEWRVQDRRAMWRDERYRAIRMGWDNPCAKHQTIGCQKTYACAVRAHERGVVLHQRGIWNRAQETA